MTRIFYGLIIFTGSLVLLAHSAFGAENLDRYLRSNRGNIDPKSIVKKSSSERPLLTCEDIKNLEIIGYIGRGNNKVAFEVKLPWGEHAVAKRCMSRVCEVKGMNRHEADLLRTLQEQYGQKNTIAFYGECDATPGSEWIDQVPGKGHDDDLVKDFSIRYTSVIELGTPLLTENVDRKHDTLERKCFSSHFTDADLEGFKETARQLAGYSSEYGPLVTHKGNDQGSNCVAEQYILVKAGIRMGDLDRLRYCKEEWCTYEKALEFNCMTMRKVSGNENLDCTTEKRDVPDDHIDADKASKQCFEKFKETS